MLLFKVLSALFEYPDAELVAALPELMTALADDAGITAAERKAIADFAGWLADTDLTEAQALYVKTFDMAPEHALHLTHQLFGDDRNRGPALIDLTEYYKSYGLEIDGNELPDYLPLVLEFASTLEEVEARVFLEPFSKAIAQLGANLAAAESPWAALVNLIEERARLVPGTLHLAPQPVSDGMCHDDECDPPVTWDAPVQAVTRRVVAGR